jgi:MOSC domain-containing protein YiiM
MRHLGHVDCGIYAEVLSSGELAGGATLAIEPDRQGSLPL